jgi:hypothetical protein
VQVSLADSGFELMSFDSTGQMNWQAVSIPDLAATQEAHVCATLWDSIFLEPWATAETIARSLGEMLRPTRSAAG